MARYGLIFTVPSNVQFIAIPAMGADVAWDERTSSLTESQQEMISGGGLSKRFSSLPLWLSHPSNIGAFYGFWYPLH